MSEDMPAAEFAALLRQLKERSGLSYGVLAKRLHMSTSTLHRYCNGDAVPTDYAPVERLARLCKAGPGELVELHRRWVLADAVRGKKGTASAGGAVSLSPSAPAGGPARPGDPARFGEPARPGDPAADAGVREGHGDSLPAAGRPAVETPESRETEHREAGTPGVGAPRAGAAGDGASGDGASGDGASEGGAPNVGAPHAGAADEESPGAGTPRAGVPGDGARRAGVPGDGSPEAGTPEAGNPRAETGQAGIPQVTGAGEARPRTRTRRTRTAVLAGIAVAAVLGGVTLALGLPDGGDAGGGDRKDPAASATLGAAGAGGNEDAAVSPSASASASPSASASASASPSGKTGETPRTPATASTGPAGDGEGSAVPLTVRTEPYAWQSPCSQRYLINRPAGEVKPPPEEPDATAWVSSFGAVSSGEQFVRLTVQGTGEETVVVEGLAVRVAGKRSPLPWNDFAMGYPGVGCGGNVPTRSFTVALDAVRPAVTPESGQRNFPFSVSESDPEVYYITADASAYDVSWYLELTWSSGSRSGTLTVDDKGRPFRTSGNNGRPAYEFPLGGEEWVPEGTTM
ncbi:helix-turn-helix domain-containing protein [Streptomyces griseoflavus]|uniref:transcriptional regulator n=1 Tax=Streptomyces griseoflavus TaxID=35619 RepID=UPI0033BD8520